MKQFRNSAAVFSIAVLLAGFGAGARADTTVIGNLPTCKAMLTNCVAFSQRAQMAAGPGGAVPENISQSACRRMHRDAERTGTWPANIPFGFAESCTTDNEQESGHKRHRVFGAGWGNNNTKPIADPAVLPTTPPAASPTQTPTAN
jgi:hypothetical protein